ncbi:MAG TPA: low temperature requirement protein A [Acidimicrobiia bacterium]|jgi:low temperature requirement protein LtrA
MAEEQHQVSSYTLEQMGVWLELFYDLVFVAAILVFSSAVSHLHDASRITWVVAVFCAVWWIWLSTTMFTNRFHMADVVHRGLVLVQMILVAVVAMEARAGVRDDEVVLLCTYAALVATIALMYWRAARARGPHAVFARHQSIVHVVATFCFVGAAALPEAARIVGAAVGMAVMIAPAAWRSIRLVDFPPLDEEHLVDRLGAFTIIVCGEAFVKVAIAVSDSKIDGIDIVALTFQFILTFALWASYFEDIPFAGIDQQRFAPWISFHLVMQLGIAGTAIGVSKLVASGFFEHLPAEDILEIMATLCLVYVGLAGIGFATRRRPRRPLLLLRLGTALVVALIGLIAWKAPWFELLEGVAMLTVAALVHAVLVARLRSRTELVPANLG